LRAVAADFRSGDAALELWRVRPGCRDGAGGLRVRCPFRIASDPGGCVIVVPEPDAGFRRGLVWGLLLELAVVAVVAVVAALGGWWPA
jgi:hypothetical protein